MIRINLVAAERPASKAASGTVSCAAGLPKKKRAAASTP